MDNGQCIYTYGYKNCEQLKWLFIFVLNPSYISENESDIWWLQEKSECYLELLNYVIGA